LRARHLKKSLLPLSLARLNDSTTARAARENMTCDMADEKRDGYDEEEEEKHNPSRPLKVNN